jgi:excisionase family DNA binding protein
MDELPVERLISPRQAAWILGASERTVYRMLKDGRLPAVHVARNVRIAPQQLQEFIARGGSK